MACECRKCTIMGFFVLTMVLADMTIIRGKGIAYSGLKYAFRIHWSCIRFKTLCKPYKGITIFPTLYSIVHYEVFYTNGYSRDPIHVLMRNTHLLGPKTWFYGPWTMQKIQTHHMGVVKGIIFLQVSWGSFIRLDTLSMVLGALEILQWSPLCVFSTPRLMGLAQGKQTLHMPCKGNCWPIDVIWGSLWFFLHQRWFFWP